MLPSLPRTFSFLDLAVFYGLRPHVRAWSLRYHAGHQEDADLISNYFREALSDPDRYIRTVTLRNMAISVDYPSPETNVVLLKFGTNPNERSGYKLVPLWEHILNRLEISNRSKAIGKKWLQIMNVFMHYDVDLRGSSGDRKVAYNRTLHVLERVSGHHPSEVASLQKMVDKKLQSKRDKLKVWAGRKARLEKNQSASNWAARLSFSEDIAHFKAIPSSSNSGCTSFLEFSEYTIGRNDDGLTSTSKPMVKPTNRIMNVAIDLE